MIWAKEWLLHFNVVKCKHLKYGNNASHYEYYMNDEGTVPGADLGFIKGGGLTQGTNLLGRGSEACWN